MAAIDEWQRVNWNAWGSGPGFRIDPSDPDRVLHPQGDALPHVTAYIRDTFGPEAIVPTPTMAKSEVLAKLPDPILCQGFLDALQASLSPDQVGLDAENRLCHSVGKNYRDLWRMRRGLVERVPDAVLLPASHRDVEHIMRAAVDHDVCLIPFGGGTNVVGAVEPDPTETRRMVVSVDMRRMGRLLSLDKHARTAVFEAGVLGPALEDLLAPHGLTLGHDPDSFVHSTLGGWVATRSSGAMSNKYGDLEDMVLALKVVTPKGTIVTPTTPRPVGPDLNEVFLGSEGVLGIITEVTVKTHPRPPVRITTGWVFPSFFAACEAAQEMVKEDCVPTILRCYDASETALSFAMKAEEGFMKHLLSKGVKQYLVWGKGYVLDEVSLVIIGHDGPEEAVAVAQAQVRRICARHHAFSAGRAAGDNWQRKKYDLPLVRDFLLDHGMWADVLETTVLYPNLITLWQQVKAAMVKRAQDFGLPLWVGCHLSHQYQSGACLYFTFAGLQKGLGDIDRFIRLKQAATEAILAHGGTLSHHHGVGYEHVPWMERYCGPGGLRLLRDVKRAVDPTGVCNPGKLLPPDQKEEGGSPLEDRMMFFRMGRMTSKL